MHLAAVVFIAAAGIAAGVLAVVNYFVNKYVQKADIAASTILIFTLVFLYHFSITIRSAGQVVFLPILKQTI
ncbi:hypothetical protein DU002_06185 [Corallincola holothuriorum]|uniref:Uncharacterized protein n=1 Tax=Corallincola holothuriorum TaxID=2282215 RepID=A0A368NJY2_9GAMM|nr:hypothetical protein DU002_06185 [Corallincola holothuriorum]